MDVEIINFQKQFLWKEMPKDYDEKLLEIDKELKSIATKGI